MNLGSIGQAVANAALQSMQMQPSVANLTNAINNCWQQDKAGSTQALQSLQALFSSDKLLASGNVSIKHTQITIGDLNTAPRTGCIPKPDLSHCGAPAGKGLSKDPEGFPKGSIRTAGGYTVVPEGKDAAWSIFAPGQKATDKPHTRVWGDPHVDEKDGTRWDFTKNSDFVLPDGTRINAQTTSETGYSVTKGLTISNGADKVQVDGISNNKPSVGNITQDGYQWRAKHMASNPGRDTFRLGGDNKDVSWFKENNGVIGGKITGAYMDKAKNRYEQKLDNGKKYWVSPELRAPLGSNAWGNQLRGQITDMGGNMLAGHPKLAEMFGGFMAADHGMAQLGQQMFAMANAFAAQQMGALGLGNMGGLGQIAQQFLANQALGEMFGGAMPFGGLSGNFGGMNMANQALGQLGQAMLAQQLMQSQASMLRNLAGVGALGGMNALNAANTTVKTGRPQKFAAMGGANFLNKLGNPSGRSFSPLNIGGGRDVRVAKDGINKLKGAKPSLSVAKPGDKGGPGKLVLSQADVAAIRGAKDMGAAKEIVRKAMERQTGKSIPKTDMNNRKAIRNGANRDAMNKLLGTKVRSGTEKNSTSSLVMDSMMESIAKSVRGSDFGTTVTQHTSLSAAQAQMSACAANPFLAMGHFGDLGAMQLNQTTIEADNAPSALAVDLNSYKAAANKFGELYSPLIFDLFGKGYKATDAEFVEVDLDGDGKMERFTDLDAHIGLLTFDSKLEGEEYGAGSEMFGNGTDLSMYGIKADTENGAFENGFDALRALAEHFDLVRAGKQHLDAGDLEILENEAGLRMRVGGVCEGEDRTFASLGVTQIALGDASKIQDIKAAEEDAYGNKLMRQEGATFVVRSTEREYVDIWFNIQGRVADEDKAPKVQSTAQLLRGVTRRL